MVIALNKKEVENILDCYSLGKYVKHKRMWWSLKNTLYSLRTTKGDFILKVFDKSNFKETFPTLLIREKLRKEGIPIPETYRTNKGDIACKYKDNPITIQKFIKGEKRPEVNIKYVKNLAKNLGLIDLNLLRIKSVQIPQRFGYQFKNSSYRSEDIILDFDYNSAEKKLVKETRKNVNKNKLRKSIIHADFASSNLIFQNKKIKVVLDWDELHKDYVVSDPSIALSHILTFPKKVKPELISAFVKEYEKYVELNSEEKKAMYYFIKNRLLGAIVWCDLQRKEHKDKAKKIGGWLKDIISFYQEFNKLSLEEFIKLAN
jgi:Ser/Thr protein kinase RdoA (MazF antagonist)